MAGVDAGVLVTCNGCGNTVLQKAMVPLLVAAEVAAEVADGASPAAGGPAPMGYLCIPCARLRIALPAEQPVLAS
jgi:hypothetical protein